MDHQFKLILFFLLFMVTLSGCEEEVRPLSKAESSLFLDQGLTVIGETQQTLSSNLMTAMQAGGVAQAVPFCNVNAYPLTDSMAQHHKVKVRRTALRYRNSNNAPADPELIVLEHFQAELDAGRQPGPSLSAISNEEVAFYSPILLVSQCTKCHGDVEEEIGEENYELIRSMYPEDLATGFKEGELRGMWSLILPRSTEM